MARRERQDGTLGGRMAASIRTSGLTQRVVAKRVGVHEKSVSRWLGDEQVPSSEDLARFAGVVGADIGWLLGGEERAMERLVDFLAQFCEAMFSGRSVPAAIERVTGRGDLLPEAEQVRLAAITGEIRAQVLERAGVSDWDQLPEDRKRQVLSEIASAIVAPEGSR